MSELLTRRGLTYPITHRGLTKPPWPIVGAPAELPGPEWAPFGASLALEFDNNRFWIGGVEYLDPVDYSFLGFTRSTVATWHEFGLTTLSSLAIDEPKISDDGIWLRPAAQQFTNNAVAPASWTLASSATRVAGGANDNWSGLTGYRIHSGANVAGRAFAPNVTPGFVAGQQYFCVWIYRRVPTTETDGGANVGSNLARLAATTTVGTSTILIAADGSHTVTEAGGTFASITHYTLANAVGLATSPVSMTTALFTAHASHAAGSFGNLGIGPNTATSGRFIIAYGVNAWNTTEQQRFSVNTHTRGVEDMSLPGLSEGLYNFVVVAPDDDEEEVQDITWTVDSIVGASVGAEFGPLLGDRQIKRLYAYSFTGLTELTDEGADEITDETAETIVVP